MGDLFYISLRRSSLSRLIVVIKIGQVWTDCWLTCNHYHTLHSLQLGATLYVTTEAGKQRELILSTKLN